MPAFGPDGPRGRGPQMGIIPTALSGDAIGSLYRLDRAPALGFRAIATRTPYAPFGDEVPPGHGVGRGSLAGPAASVVLRSFRDQGTFRASPTPSAVVAVDVAGRLGAPRVGACRRLRSRCRR